MYTGLETYCHYIRSLSTPSCQSSPPLLNRLLGDTLDCRHIAEVHLYTDVDAIHSDAIYLISPNSFSSVARVERLLISLPLTKQVRILGAYVDVILHYGLLLPGLYFARVILLGGSSATHPACAVQLSILKNAAGVVLKDRVPVLIDSDHSLSTSGPKTENAFFGL